jgi:cell division protein ZapB
MAQSQFLCHSSESIQWETMEDTDLQALMARLELLITRVEQLKRQNGLLLAQEKSWREERAHLIEKNEIARQKVETMISRLKALEQDS